MKHRLVFLALLITIIFGSMYGLLQVMNRSLANDMPQLLATQAAKQLDAGLGLESIQMGRTDLANNPVPFIVVFDKKSKPLVGSGYLNGKLAQMPVGVVNHATKNDPHAVTWAPRPDVRIASVTALSTKSGYYVVGGQSLKPTEARANKLMLLTIFGYLVSLSVLLAWEFLVRRDRFGFDLPHAYDVRQRFPLFASKSVKDIDPEKPAKKPAKRLKTK